MFTLILGKDDDSIVDVGLVGILGAYNTVCRTPSFTYAQALEMGMWHQLINLFISYLVYLFIFSQSAHLTHLNLQLYYQSMQKNCVY